MEDTRNNYLRFVSLRLRDYKVFGGLNDFRFNRHRTLIVGKGGTGKTIIAQALESLGPSRRIRETFTSGDHAVSYLTIITQGNCDLISKYRSLIFLNPESVGYLVTHRQGPRLKAMVPSSTRRAVASKTRTFFQKILSCKPWKIDSHRELNAQVMAGGERICLGYAFVFAVRAALKLDVPVVFDSPYAMVDEGLREGMRNFLKAQPCQQILLGHEREFSDGETPKYILVNAENYSHVMEY